jgi:serine/threonine protein phosphatase PrpC
VAALRAESGAGSHPGCVRERNEDSFVEREQEGLWAVAVGMGGEANGDWASAALVEALGSVPLPLPFAEACEAIPDAIRKANAQIYERSIERGRTMGSTVVVLFAQDERFVVFWAGDSRAYLLRDGALHRVSRDHSQVQEMVDRGMLRPDQAHGHPMGHVLARAVGVEGNLELDAVQGEIHPGDVFLLCSDGLHGYLPESDIARLLGGTEPLQSVEQLIAATLELGAPDNVTAIAIGFGDPTVLSIGGGLR